MLICNFATVLNPPTFCSANKASGGNCTYRIPSWHVWGMWCSGCRMKHGFGLLLSVRGTVSCPCSWSTYCNIYSQEGKLLTISGLKKKQPNPHTIILILERMRIEAYAQVQFNASFLYLSPMSPLTSASDKPTTSQCCQQNQTSYLPATLCPGTFVGRSFARELVQPIVNLFLSSQCNSTLPHFSLHPINTRQAQGPAAGQEQAGGSLLRRSTCKVSVGLCLQAFTRRQTKSPRPLPSKRSPAAPASLLYFA